MFNVVVNMLIFTDFRGKKVICSDVALKHIRDDHYGYSADPNKSYLYQPKHLPRLLEAVLKFGSLHAVQKKKNKRRLTVRVHCPIPVGFDARQKQVAFCLNAIIQVPGNQLCSLYPVSCKRKTCKLTHASNKVCSNFHIVKDPKLTNSKCRVCNRQVFGEESLNKVPCKLNENTRNWVEQEFFWKCKFLKLSF